ncbi:MAG: glycosyltransferase family 2 protein [Candidatus Erginobacter occultus]|nr:glycosyltransferase family 2 protein [Candidatus Erginobacter occultus]
MEILFIISALLIMYAYLGYPLVLLGLTLGRNPRPDYSGRPRPRVSILIPVYNEQEVIVKKLKNALSLDYPEEKLEIVVASDGSSDRTAELVRPFLSRSVRLEAYPEHRGKMSAINRAAPGLSGEIIVFTDASAFFSPEALNLLLAGFSDPGVGAVSGALVLREEAAAGGELSVDWYWRLEKFIRERESRLYSTVGATGAIWALRRELFSPLPEDTVLDDFLLPLSPLRKGYRIYFESRALAFEERHTDLRSEFRRKVRTLAGNYQAFARARWLFKSKIAFQLISHKLCRLLVPFALLGLLFSSLFGPAALRPVFYLQAIFYGLAAAGWLAVLRGRKPGKLLSVPLTFCLLNGAALKAFFVYFSGLGKPVWR